MIPGAQASILEPFLIQRNRVAMPMQLMVGNIFGDANARLRRYSVAPISVYVLDADGMITAVESRGRFPDMYRDSAIRVMSYACARDGNDLYFAFGRDPLFYRYDLLSGDPVDSLSRPIPVAFDHVPFNAEDNTSRAFREYYHQVSRSHALKVLAPGVLARTFVKGKPLPTDSVITRSYDAMDWIIATYGADGTALFYHVNGQEYLNTFFENIGSDVYLLSSTSSDDEIILVRAELVDA